MICRERALELLQASVKNEKLVKHMLAVGAIMRKLASWLKEDEQRWELVGLLHDLDYERADEKNHGLLTCEELKDLIDEEMKNCIKAHNFEHTGVLPRTKMDVALLAADNVAGLVVATCLILPSKKLEDLELKTLRKKFKQKDFARSCNRNKILVCEKIGVPLEKFLEISLQALREIHESLGL